MKTGFSNQVQFFGLKIRFWLAEIHHLLLYKFHVLLLLVFGFQSRNRLE